MRARHGDFAAIPVYLLIMEMDDDDDERGISPAVTLYSILGFWLFYVIIVTLRSLIVGFESQGEMAIRRIVVTVIGIVLTWCLYLVLRRFDRFSIGARVAIASLTAIPVAIAVGGANYYMFNVYDQASMFQDISNHSVEKMDAWQEVGELAVTRYFFLIAWASLYLALSYASDSGRAERRAARLARAAQQAELRSLRYQVNPHFLFNTLNSLSSLVLKSRNDEAEAMIMSLSNFYRTSLTSDPLDDVPLSEEVHLQKLYLDIEAVRFPERLRTRIEIPDALLDCCVPGLILQPLVENAIKYGVSRTTRPVTITMRAADEGGKLALTVTDDGEAMPDEDPDMIASNGIGLANVRDRLTARFGDQASFLAGPVHGGGFAVKLLMPQHRAGC